MDSALEGYYVNLDQVTGTVTGSQRGRRPIALLAVDTFISDVNRCRLRRPEGQDPRDRSTGYMAMAPPSDRDTGNAPFALLDLDQPKLIIPKARSFL